MQITVESRNKQWGDLYLQ